jgi:proteic killer suppression protein
MSFCAIGNIRHKGLAALYYDDRPKGVKESLVKRLRYILALLATAFTVEDMNIPSLKLHQLKGDLAGFYAVSVSGNWRVLFRFEERQAIDVDLIDYY